MVRFRGWPLGLLVFILALFAHAQDPSPVAPPQLPFPQETRNSLYNLISAKKYDDALKQIDTLTGQYPDSADLRLLQIAAYHGIGNATLCQSSARDFLGKFTDVSGRDQVLFLLGASLRGSGKTEEAHRYLLEAASLARDESLRSNIRALLEAVRNERGIGLNLGGKPPAADGEKQKLAQVGKAVIERGLKDYRERFGKYPESLAQLREGNPPTLKMLPEDPFNPGDTYLYRLDGESVVLQSATPPTPPVKATPGNGQ